MDLRPVGVNGILAVLGDSISEQTGAQVAALREAIADAHISSVEAVSYTHLDVYKRQRLQRG